MTKKVGIITFHAAHNYGSMLQSYALQQVVTQLGYDCEIINLRTKIQKKYYTPAHKGGKSFIERSAKRIGLAIYKKKLLEKHRLFEYFLENDYTLSEHEYSSLEELCENPPDYDFYISGSDQIWNTACTDFDWSYYLPFVKEGKRIAYAPSMGQRATQDFSKHDKTCFEKYLSNYDFISTREEDTAMVIEDVLKVTPEITLDPTLLLDSSEWKKKFNSAPIIKGDYIFYYVPRIDTKVLNLTRRIAKKTKLPIVTSIMHSSKFAIFYPDFQKEIAVGPWEFLNLCINAKLLCGRSYHLNVFAIIFNIPFYAINGLKVNRTKRLLDWTNLTDRTISIDDFEQKIDAAFEVDFSDANRKINEQKTKSLKFLKHALQS